MSELTLDEAIKHCLEVADKNEIDSITYKNCKEIKTNMYEKLIAEKLENDCRDCAADHKQLAEWLRELKERRATVKCGKWIDVYEYCKINGYKPSGVAAYRWCSECMKGQEKTSDFCPNCGAKMST